MSSRYRVYVIFLCCLMTGPSLHCALRATPIGLRNFAANCFLNALIQALGGTIFPEQLLALSPSTIPHKSVTQAYCSLFEQYKNASPTDIVDPAKCYDILLQAGIIRQQFAYDNVQLVFEESMTLIQQECPLFVNPFFFAMRIMLEQCTNCGTSDRTPRMVTSFMLDIEAKSSGVDNLQDALKNFLNSPVTTLVACESCKSTAKQQNIRLTKLPSCLAISISPLMERAFTYNVKAPLQLDMRIALEESLDLNTIYTLKAIVAFRGNFTSGHYIAYVVYNATWYKCNDNHIISQDSLALENKLTTQGNIDSYVPMLLFYVISPSTKNEDLQSLTQLEAELALLSSLEAG